MPQIRSDESIVFFPTAARLSDDGKTWAVPIHGWIFEREEDDLLRAHLRGQLASFLPAETTAEQRATFDLRLQPFLVDNERGKMIRIAICEREFELGPSAVDGHFLGTIALSVDEVARHSSNGRLEFSAILSVFDSRAFGGTVFLVPPQGLSLISDIDDTVKITEVRQAGRVFASTFLDPFQSVPGMAEIYRAHAEQGVQIHYVSMSPWQLYRTLDKFLVDEGFPDALFHLQRFRPKDSSLFSLLRAPRETKTAMIDAIFQQFPQRQFILVGDSGQEDPEVYAAFAQRHADRVKHIYIRNVSNEPSTADRYLRLFGDIPRDKWTVFDDAREIRSLR